MAWNEPRDDVRTARRHDRAADAMRRGASVGFPKRLFRKLSETLASGRREKGAVPDDVLHGYDLEEAAREAIRLVRPYTMATYPRLVTLYQQVVHCETTDLSGSYVECGTWKGGAAGLMALANLKTGRRRRHVHLFDSFEGIPEPDEGIDGERAVREVAAVGGKAEGRLSPVKGFYDRFADGTGTLEINRRLFEELLRYDPAFVHYHKGWFQETLPRDSAAVGPIAILRLDGDWYASTKVCLEHLYGQVVPGGFVIVDDYGTYEGCRKAVDEFIDGSKIRPFLVHVDASARYWVKQER